MDEATQRALAALADGTLDPAARDELLRRIDADPELADALDRQRRARSIVGAAEAPASASLRATVAALAARETPDRGRFAPRERRRRIFALGGGGAAAALAAAAVLLFTGGGPSVAQAAQAALAPASGGAPGVRPGEHELAVSVDGVAYPYWGDSTSWQAIGSRRDEIGGRAITTVFYGSAEGQRLGYAITAGAPLSVHDGTITVRDGVRYRTLHADGATIVTWLRDGHTCLLVARGVPATVLLTLASWHDA